MGEPLISQNLLDYLLAGSRTYTPADFIRQIDTLVNSITALHITFAQTFPKECAEWEKEPLGKEA